LEVFRLFARRSGLCNGDVCGVGGSEEYSFMMVRWLESEAPPGGMIGMAWDGFCELPVWVSLTVDGSNQLKSRTKSSGSMTTGELISLCIECESVSFIRPVTIDNMVEAHLAGA
jgi:hypothetical protein